MWQMHLLKNWRASFYVAKKKRHAKVCSCARPVTKNLLQPLAKVMESPHAEDVQPTYLLCSK